MATDTTDLGNTTIALGEAIFQEAWLSCMSLQGIPEERKVLIPLYLGHFLELGL